MLSVLPGDISGDYNMELHNDKLKYPEQPKYGKEAELLPSLAKKFKLKNLEQFENVQRHLHQLSRCGIDTRSDYNSAIRAVMLQLKIPKNVKSDVLRHQIAAHMAEDYTFYYPKMKEYLKHHKLSYGAYVMQIFSGNIWADEFVLGAIGRMFDIKISVISPYYDDVWRIFHDSALPHVVIISNGSDFGKKHSPTHFSATKGSEAVWNCVGSDLNVGEMGTWKGYESGREHALEAFQMKENFMLLKDTRKMAIQIQELCRDMNDLCLGRDKIYGEMAKMNIRVDQFKRFNTYYYEAPESRHETEEVTAEKSAKPKKSEGSGTGTDKSAKAKKSEESGIGSEKSTKAKKSQGSVIESEKSAKAKESEVSTKESEVLVHKSHKKHRKEKKIEGESTKKSARSCGKFSKELRSKLMSDVVAEIDKGVDTTNVPRQSTIEDFVRSKPGGCKIKHAQQKLPPKLPTLADYCDMVEEEGENTSQIETTVRDLKQWEIDNQPQTPYDFNAQEDEPGIVDKRPISPEAGFRNVVLTQPKKSGDDIFTRKRPNEDHIESANKRQHMDEEPDVYYHGIPMTKNVVDYLEQQQQPMVHRTCKTMTGTPEPGQQIEISNIVQDLSIAEQVDISQSQTVYDDPVYDVDDNIVGFKDHPEVNIFIPRSRIDQAQERSKLKKETLTEDVSVDDNDKTEKQQPEIKQVKLSHPREHIEKLIVKIPQNIDTSKEPPPIPRNQRHLHLHYCNRCSFSTKYRAHLEKHNKRLCPFLTVVERIKCPEENCGKLFKNENSYKDHSYQHKGICNYQCHKCGQAFILQNQLARHKKKC